MKKERYGKFSCHFTYEEDLERLQKDKGIEDCFEVIKEPAPIEKKKNPTTPTISQISNIKRFSCPSNEDCAQFNFSNEDFIGVEGEEKVVQGRELELSDLLEVLSEGFIRIYSGPMPLEEYVIKRYNEYVDLNSNPDLRKMDLETNPEEFKANAVDNLRHDAVIEHELGDFDYDYLLRLLDRFEGHHDESGLYETLVRHIHEKIANTYPFLRETCERKNEEKFNENQDVLIITINDILDLEIYSFRENLLHFKLKPFYKEFYDQRKTFAISRRVANVGFKLRPSFIEFISNHSRLNLRQKRELLDIIDEINNGKWIQKYLIYIFINTDWTPKRIGKMELIKGLEISPILIEKLNNEYELKSRRIRTCKFDLKDFNTLINSHLQTLFIKYYSIVGKYPNANIGTKINQIFIDWVISLSSMDRVVKARIVKKCNTINRRLEIEKYVVHRFVTSNDPYRIIQKVVKKLGLNLSKHTYFSILDKYGVRSLRRGTSGKFKGYTLTDFAEYIKKLVETKLKKELNLEDGHAPTYQQMQIIDGNFLKEISDNGYKYNDVLRAAGFSLRYDYDKYEKFNLQDFAQYLNLMLASGLREELDLDYRESPTYKQLQNYSIETSHFINALNTRGIKLNDVLKAAGLRINRELGKFENFGEKEYGEYLKSLLDKGLRSKIGLKGRNGPTKRELVEFGHADLIGSLDRHKISFPKLLRSINLIPREREILIEIGVELHWCLEKIFMEHAYENNYKAFWEVYPKTEEDKRTRKKADNIILISKRLRTQLNQFFPISKDIKMIIIDYFFGSSKEEILIKLNRGYQKREKLLIIIPSTLRVKERIPPKTTPFYENVKIFNPNYFLKIFNFKLEHIEQFKNVITLSSSAKFDKNSKKELKRIARKSEEELRYLYNYRQSALISDLKKLNWIYLLNQ